MRIVGDGVAGRISDKKDLVAILLVIVVGVVVYVLRWSHQDPKMVPT